MVFTGTVEAADLAAAELRGAGIEVTAIPNTSRLSGFGNQFQIVDIAVPRRYALEASHVLRLDLTDPEEGEQDRRRRNRSLLALVAAVVLAGLLLGSLSIFVR
ncbi:MAG: hypothetical protein NVS9B1_02800 [Candidatus Dormibacteraceae bacterium]